VDVNAFSSALKRALSSETSTEFAPLVEQLKVTNQFLTETSRKLDSMAERAEILKVEVRTLQGYVSRVVKDMTNSIERQAETAEKTKRDTGCS
jgi:predicted transcriptional regulator